MHNGTPIAIEPIASNRWLRTSIALGYRLVPIKLGNQRAMVVPDTDATE